MKTIVEKWDESVMELEDYQAERAMQKGIIDAMRRALQLGADFIMEENGKMKRVPPQEIGELEKQATVNLNRLNKIIADFEESQSVYALNDKPRRS